MASGNDGPGRRSAVRPWWRRIRKLARTSVRRAVAGLRRATATGKEVRAAGGVVWRRADDCDGGMEIVLVHRASYDDWSLPKGKSDPGETDEQTALREVEEEIGVVGQLGPELPATRYRDRFGRPKVVRYWAMTPVSGQVGGCHEIDDAQWFPIEVARDKLTYERDRDVVDALGPALT